MMKWDSETLTGIDEVFAATFGSRMVESFRPGGGYANLLNEKRAAVIKDLINSQTRDDAAKIEADIKRTIQAFEAELSGIALEATQNEQQLKDTRALIARLKEETTSVVLTDPKRATELGNKAELEGFRVEALIRLQDESKTKKAAAEERRVQAIEAANATEVDIWKAEAALHEAAIVELVAKLYNHRQAMKQAYENSNAARRKFNGLLPKPAPESLDDYYAHTAENAWPNDIGPGQVESNWAARLNG